MALTLILKRTWWTFFVYLVFISYACNGFSLPGRYMHTYSTGEEIYAKTNSLTSIKTELISPYRFRMNKNESVFIRITDPLNKYEVKLLKQRTRELYHVNIILDNMPAMSFINQKGVQTQWTGCPVGYTSPNGDDDYIMNHLKFTVIVREYDGTGVEIIGKVEEGMGISSTADDDDKQKASGYEIVGFEVYPCSVKYDPDIMSKLHKYDNVTSVNCPMELEKSQIIREQERVSFTYEVEFVKSDIKWPKTINF